MKHHVFTPPPFFPSFELTLGSGCCYRATFDDLEPERGCELNLMGNGQKKETNDFTDLCWNQSVCISVVFAVIYLEAFFNHGKIYWQFFGIACVSNSVFVGR